MSKGSKQKLHLNNRHKSGYDFDSLCKVLPSLNQYVFTNKFSTKTIDFALPEAVKALNTALLFKHYNLRFWEFPDNHLCPPIPGRSDYIHYLNDLLETSNLKGDLTILDIGTGATCIYPLLGQTIYNWNFVATDISEEALLNSELIVEKNGLSKSIRFRKQKDASQILKGILSAEDKFYASMCNPPFFKSEQEALSATKRKLKGLSKSEDSERNFSGTADELSYKGGEKAFLHNYLYESSLFKTQCFWYTSLVSNKDNIKSMKQSLTKLGAKEIKVIDMAQGNKVSRVVAWTFLTKELQKDWNK